MSGKPDNARPPVRNVPMNGPGSAATDSRDAHDALLSDYRSRWPAEAATVDRFSALLSDAEDPFRRERLAGHFTASAWLVDATGTRVLLTHHRKLDRWLQLGPRGRRARLRARGADRSRRGVGARRPVGRTGHLRPRCARHPRTQGRAGARALRRALRRARGEAKPSSSATNRMRSRGARSMRWWTTPTPIRRCDGWRRSGWTPACAGVTNVSRRGRRTRRWWC